MLEGRMVRQLAVTTEGPDRSPTGVRSVYALVGSCLTERADVDEKILTEMISSFTVTAGCGSSAGPSRLASAPAPTPPHCSAKPTGHIPGPPPSPAAASAYPAHSR
jgi:hypothetical protein